MSLSGDATGDTPLPVDISIIPGGLRPDQVQRAESLRRLSANGPTIADLYIEAAGRVEGCTTEARLAILAHCVREILNRLPGVLGHVFDDYRNQQADALKRLAAAAEARANHDAYAGDRDEKDIAHLSRAVDDAVAEVVESHQRGRGENEKKSRALVVGRAGGERVPDPPEAAVDVVNRVRTFFAERAHVAEEPREVPALDAIRRHFELAESTLDHGLEQFWRGHQAMRGILGRANASVIGADGLPIWSEPSEVDLEELALALASSPNASVFFNELLNPAWLAPLRRENIIGAPRAPTAVEGGGATFPNWPAGGYLACMASERPEEVVGFFLDVDLAGNGLAERHLVDAAIALPVELAVQLRKRVTAALRRDGGWLNPERLVVLVERLEAATSKKALKQLVTALFGAPSALDNYWYKELLPRAAEALRRALGPDAVAMLTGYLHDHASAEDRGQSRGWRSEVAQSREDYIFEVGNALVDATRDAALALVAASPDSLREVVDRLLAPSIRTGASARIAMVVVAEAIRAGIPSADAIGQDLLLDPLHLAWEYEPEYSALGRLVLADAGREVVDAWYVIVKSDPEFAGTGDGDIREIAARFAVVDVSDVTEVHIERLERYRERSHLALMEGSLPDELTARLTELDAELDAEFGPRPPREPWGPTVTSFVGPTSPKTADELEAMSGDELVDYLKEWRPSEQARWGPTPEGLGRQLADHAERHPDRTCDLADRLIELAPTYLRHIVQGWEQAVRKGDAGLDWDQVVKVIGFISEQPDEGDVPAHFDEDLGWRGAHQAAASLLDRALSLNTESAPGVGLRTIVWSAIERLAESPDPSPAREAERDIDAETMSINSVRPYAVSAAVMYLWWLVQGGLVARGEDSSDTAREVWELLDRHLDPQIDPSPAVRATLGRLFPFLASVFPTWARDRTSLFFGPGRDDVDTRRADAAWSTYVRRADPNALMLDLLVGNYLERLQRQTSAEQTAESRESAEARTAEHVLLLYTNGNIGLGSDDGLVAALFASYTPQMLAHVLGHFGWLLSRYTVALRDDQVDRLAALWEWRRETVDGGGDPAELAGFGWWFRSDVFPIHWAASQLVHAATHGVTFDGSSDIIERLADHAQEVTDDAVTFLESAIQSREPWDAQWVGRGSAPIIAAGLESTDPAVRTRAHQVLQTLGAAGLLTLFDDVEAIRAEGHAPPDAPGPDQ